MATLFGGAQQSAPQVAAVPASVAPVTPGTLVQTPIGSSVTQTPVYASETEEQRKRRLQNSIIGTEPLGGGGDSAGGNAGADASASDGGGDGTGGGTGGTY